LKRKLFGELVKSIREAGAIARGERKPARRVKLAFANVKKPTAARKDTKRRPGTRKSKGQ
jgi:hypothetical protein